MGFLIETSKQEGVKFYVAILNLFTLNIALKG